MKSQPSNELVVQIPEGAIILDIQRKGRELRIKYDFPETMEIIYESDKDRFNTLFPVVEASKLSLKDRFMEYKPINRQEQKLKKSLTKLIEEGIEDFRCQAMDPSEILGGILIFEKGKQPAVGHSANWWNEKAMQVMPSKNSCLGSKKRYDAFLGVIIKYLVDEKKYDVSDAWYEVCTESKELGHYQDSPRSIEKKEPTGSRKIKYWSDLANVCKIIKSKDNYLLVSGTYQQISRSCPLTDCVEIQDAEEEFSLSVGWITLDL